MFDGNTLKSSPALAVKSIEALKDGSKVFVADERMLARRSQDNIIRYLTDLGISTLKEIKLAPKAETQEDLVPELALEDDAPIIEDIADELVVDEDLSDEKTK